MNTAANSPTTRRRAASNRIVLPRVRSIVWLGIKVYVIVVIGLSLLGVAVVFLDIALVTVMR